MVGRRCFSCFSWWLAALLVSSTLLGALTSSPTAVGAAESGEHAAGVQTILRESPDEVFTYSPPPIEPAMLRAQAAMITVEYRDFPPEAKAAFQYAVNIWQGLLTSPVPIAISANWTALDEGNLGSAGAAGSWRNFTGAPQKNIWYPNGLANKLAGRDLSASEADVEASFNSAYTNWYFGTDQAPAGKASFVTVVLHEIGHGLGIAGSARVNGAGVGQWGSSSSPFGYDTFVVNGAGVATINTDQYPNPSATLAAQYQGGNLFFDGPATRAANGGERAKLYAPGTWQQGSSYGHLDEKTYPAGTPNALMTPVLSRGETNLNPGPIVLGMLTDMGWTVTPGETSPTCFPQTGKCIKGRFAEYWFANGGLAQQGYPLTDEFDEINPTDGKTYKTQYFERARFEYHPDNQRPYDVLLGLLGREQYLAKYRNGLPLGGGDPFNDPRLPQECATFAETGKQVCGPFLVYWREHGGLAQQGLPLTDLFIETNPTDGKPYPTQYFERARFEYHEANFGTPYAVLLGLLGREQLLVKYPNGQPSASASPSASPMPSASPSPSPSASASPSPSPSPGGPWGPTLAPLTNGQLYVQPGGAFSVSIPGSWQVLATTEQTVSIGSLSPAAACSVGVDTVPEGTTLAIVDAAFAEANATLPNYQPVSKEQVLVRAQSAYRRVLTYTFEDGTPAQEQQVYFLFGYSLTLVSCVTAPAQFAALASTFNGIAGSVKLARMATIKAAAPQVSVDTGARLVGFGWSAARALLANRLR